MTRVCYSPWKQARLVPGTLRQVTAHSEILSDIGKLSGSVLFYPLPPAGMPRAVVTAAFTQQRSVCGDFQRGGTSWQITGTPLILLLPDRALRSAPNFSSRYME